MTANRRGNVSGGPKPAAANKMRKPPSLTTKKASSPLLRVGTLLAALALAALFYLASPDHRSKLPSLSGSSAALRSILEKGWEHYWKTTPNGAAEGAPAPAPPSPSPMIKPSSSSSSPSSSTCDAASLALAAAKLAPLASQLVATPFFRHFKVGLRCECPFWPDDGMCSMSDCAVCECPAEEVPEALRDGDEPRELASCSAAAGKASSSFSSSSSSDAAAAADAAVDREVEPDTRARLIAAKGWRGVDNPWMAGSIVAVAEEEGEGGGEAKLDKELGDEDDEDDGEEEEEDEDKEEDEDDSYSFIDLLKNPERYTGYSGPSARRIWDFVYSQTCFGGRGSGSGRSAVVVGGGTSETSSSSSTSSSPSSSAAGGICSAVQQTLYRVMSGVHSSISAHIAADYLLEPAASGSGGKEGEEGEKKKKEGEEGEKRRKEEGEEGEKRRKKEGEEGEKRRKEEGEEGEKRRKEEGEEGEKRRKEEAVWGPNLALFVERLSLPERAERIDNLRFAYAFVARALLSARPLLLAADYGAGGGGGGGGRGGGGGERGSEKTAESELVRELLTDPALEGVCAAPFDASRHLPLLSSRAAERALEKELQAAFRNVTAVMDCVGCEKCKLWGKLQLMGVATALKVLVAERRTGEAMAAAASTSGRRGQQQQAGAPSPKPLVLERNEVVALVNLFERLSRSMNIVREMQARLDSGEIPAWPERAARGSGGGEREGSQTDALAGDVGVF